MTWGLTSGFWGECPESDPTLFAQVMKFEVWILSRTLEKFGAWSLVYLKPLCDHETRWLAVHPKWEPICIRKHREVDRYTLSCAMDASKWAWPSLIVLTDLIVGSGGIWWFSNDVELLHESHPKIWVSRWRGLFRVSFSRNDKLRYEGWHGMSCCKRKHL